MWAGTRSVEGSTDRYNVVQLTCDKVVASFGVGYQRYNLRFFPFYLYLLKKILYMYHKTAKRVMLLAQYLIPPSVRPCTKDHFRALAKMNRLD